MNLFAEFDVNTLCLNAYNDAYKLLPEKNTRFRSSVKTKARGGEAIPGAFPVKGFSSLVDAV